MSWSCSVSIWNTPDCLIMLRSQWISALITLHCKMINDDWYNTAVHTIRFFQRKYWFATDCYIVSEKVTAKVIIIFNQTSKGPLETPKLNWKFQSVRKYKCKYENTNANTKIQMQIRKYKCKLKMLKYQLNCRFQSKPPTAKYALSWCPWWDF